MNRSPYRAARSRPDGYGVPHKVCGRGRASVTLTTETWAWQLRQPLVALLIALLVLGALGAWPPLPAGAASCVVTSALDDNGAGTLRARLADPACDTIAFQDGLGPISLAAGLNVDHDVTIEGPGQVVQYTGGPSATGYVLMITGGTVTLRGLTIQGGHTAGFSGAGISISGGAVTLDGVTVRDNRVQNDAGGGGIYVTDAALHLNNTVVEGNIVSSAPGGGGLYIDNTFGDVAVTIAGGSQIIGNQASTHHGGGIIVAENQSGYSATLTMNDSVLGTRARPNVADQIGGGLNNYGGTVTLTNVSIGGNTGEVGGGIYHQGGTTTLTNVAIDGNKAQYGGGYYLDRGTAILTNVTISDNQVTNGHGGGFYNLVGTASLTNATITGNATNVDGGGLYTYNGTTALTNVTVSGNSARGSGGGIYNTISTTTLRFVTLTDNVADHDANGTGTGGGLFREGGELNLASSIVAGNRRGAAIADDCNVGITSQGYNLVGSATGCPSSGPGDLVLTGALATVLQPALAENGGASRTHALVPGSPALDRIPLAQCAATTDQRGFARPQNGLCDVGAVESMPAAPSPSSGARAALTMSIVGGGRVDRDPQGEGEGPSVYPTGTLVTLTADPDDYYTFVGWSVDGVSQGWANPLTITMKEDYRVQAIFRLTASFSDVGAGRGDHAAIIALATRRAILGYGDGTFGPDDRVSRAQMAALIARATPAGPGTPTNGTLTPPACLVAQSWDCEDWGNDFTDQGGVDPNLWRNAGTLQHYGVALGYGAAQCAARGVAAPCFDPNDEVTYAQTISFITRAMIVKGYWVAQPAAPLPYAGVPAAHQPDVRTFVYYTGGIPAPPADWDAPATRGWFAQALWAALDSYWGTDRTP